MEAFDSAANEGSGTPTTEAVRWFLRIQNGRLSAVEQTRFDAWRGVAANAAAYAKAANIWCAIDAVACEPDIVRRREQIVAQVERRRFYSIAAIAAGVATLMLGIVLLTDIAEPFGARLQAWFAPANDHERVTRATRVGERSALTLPDGSTLILNTDSAAVIAFDADARKITLTRGQALFEVAKHQSRPFVVYARDRRIVATGTAFDVRTDAAHVAVTLVEGRVLVADATAKPASHRAHWLNPGERLVATSGAGVSITAANVEQITSWTSGKLTFLATRAPRSRSPISRLPTYASAASSARVNRPNSRAPLRRSIRSTSTIEPNDAFVLLYGQRAERPPLPP